MKKIDTSNALGNVRQPFIAGSIQHLQEAYLEIVDAIAKSLVGDDAGVHILYGVVNEGDTTDYDITAGALFYNGEVYLVDATAFTVGGGETAVGTIVTTYRSGDPVKFSNGAQFNVHEIRKIVFASDTSGSGIADFDELIDHSTENTEVEIPIPVVTGYTGNVYVRKHAGLLYFRGGWDISGSAGSGTTTIPNGWAPVVDRSFHGCIKPATTGTPTIAEWANTGLIIGASGSVSVVNAGSHDISVIFDDLPPLPMF